MWQRLIAAPAADPAATFSFINADQALYYMANPENNRKVANVLCQCRMIVLLRLLPGLWSTASSDWGLCVALGCGAW